MNVEHCDCLSWFSRRCESHKQDGETLPAQHGCNTCPASGDPAMAFGPSVGRERATARSTDRQRRCRTKSGGLMRSATNARDFSARKFFNGEYQAVQSAPGNAPHSCAEDNRESAGAATRALTARAANDCP